MPNAIKYNTNAETLALKKGNFWIGTGDVGKGPSSSTGFYNGLTPTSGGYVIYSYNPSLPGNTAYFTVANDSELISYTNRIAGTSYTTANECLVYYAGQTDKVCVNIDYPPIVTNGLVLNLDAGFTPSYPRTNTTWYDTSGNGNNINLINGPTFDTANGGSIVFDGSDDYAQNDSPNLPTGNVITTICAWIYVVSGYGDWQGIAGWGNAGVFSNSALLDMNQGRLAFSTWGYPGAEDLISSYNVPKNTWKYVVGSINNRNIKLYADGVNVLNSSITSTPNVTSTKLRLATTDYPGRLLNTKISSVQIYNRELSQTEITQNYNATKSRFGL
jgi:hypothetical protein